MIDRRETVRREILRRIKQSHGTPPKPRKATIWIAWTRKTFQVAKTKSDAIELIELHDPNGRYAVEKFALQVGVKNVQPASARVMAQLRLVSSND